MESGTAEKIETTNGANGLTAAADRIEVLNPANGETVASVAVDSPESVAATVARVRANQPHWEALGNEGRYRWLGQLRDWLLDNEDHVADMIQAETGKVRADACAEVIYVTGVINYYGANAEKLIGEEQMRP